MNIEQACGQMLEQIQRILSARETSHRCCMHLYSGILHMVVHDGHVVEQCCECRRMTTRHADPERGPR